MKRNLLCATISLGLLFILSFSVLHPVYAGTTITPTITTVISGDTSVGGQALDTATVTGTPGTAPGGTLTFYLYDNPSCTGQAVFSFGPVVSSSQDSATGQSSFGPAYYTIISAGTFYWVAAYNGDSNYNSITSGCADEPVTFTLATPTITTTQEPNSQLLGNGIFDQASLSGGFNPTGTVTFNLYDNAVCSGTPLFTDTESVHSVFAGVYATSAPYTTTSSGTFYWVATYNGDTYDSSVSSSCGAEPVMVTGATGAPEFPLGSLGPLLLIALLLPALVVMGKKFGARQPV